MAMHPLPPQAYTKETLVQSYAWLQNQSEGIKEIATTPDILVSLYLKAKLQGESALERPSIQNFKNELRSLAGMMGEFEIAELKAPAAPTPPVATSPSQAYAQAAPPQPQPQAPAPTKAPLESKKADQLCPDSNCQAMIQEVKTHLNLSSEQEALRVLVSLGYKQIKPLIK
jgi:hypothetical protein